MPPLRTRSGRTPSGGSSSHPDAGYRRGTRPHQLMREHLAAGLLSYSRERGVWEIGGLQAGTAKEAMRSHEAHLRRSGRKLRTLAEEEAILEEDRSALLRTYASVGGMAPPRDQLLVDRARALAARKTLLQGATHE